MWLQVPGADITPHSSKLPRRLGFIPLHCLVPWGESCTGGGGGWDRWFPVLSKVRPWARVICRVAPRLLPGCFSDQLFVSVPQAAPMEHEQCPRGG